MGRAYSKKGKLLQGHMHPELEFLDLSYSSTSNTCFLITHTTGIGKFSTAGKKSS